MKNLDKMSILTTNKRTKNKNRSIVSIYSSLPLKIKNSRKKCKGMRIRWNNFRKIMRVSSNKCISKNWPYNRVIIRYRSIRGFCNRKKPIQLNCILWRLSMRLRFSFMRSKFNNYRVIYRRVYNRNWSLIALKRLNSI